MFFQVFLLFVIGHCLADTSLQTDAMAKGKNRHNPITYVPVGQKPLKLWWHWLTHHSMIHGGAVIAITYILTGNFNLSIVLGVIEIVWHWFIDYMKCESMFNPHVDQLLHLSLKAFYALYLIKL